MRLKKAAFIVLAALSASGVLASPLLSGWHRESAPGAIKGVGSYSVAIPPTMQKVPVTGVDSYVAEYRSSTLTLLFDFGVHAVPATPSCRGKARCTIGTFPASGDGRARRIRYYVPDPDGGLPYRNDYEIPLLGGAAMATRPISLTIHAECANPAACDLADRIVKTIELRLDR